ncbi:MAG TPA: histone deacetylase [Thermoanaerobaculia bacterium]|nr:histone deacetylase [Thermoanaerobaculia bacterium]
MSRARLESSADPSDNGAARSSIGIFTDDRFLAHDTGPGHPERPERMQAAREGVRRAGLDERVIVPDADHPQTRRIIAAVHSDDYRRELEEAAAEGAPFFHSMDNSISRATSAAAEAAVSLALHAADELFERRSLRRAFLPVRPPGHHAERRQAMGFCFYNTIACAAEFLREKQGIDRVFILDWDVHHGNGTQHLFESRDDVFYASIHRFPFYPGTGASGERGKGDGAGATLNVPLDAGATDSIWLDAFERQVLPAIRDFEPRAILISAGFDAYASDPLGGMRLTETAFATMTRQIGELADSMCEGRLLSLLEGGYDLEGLARCTMAHLVAMSGDS